MSGITTHVLDTARGQPAAGVRVRVARVSETGDEAATAAEAFTDKDGRVAPQLPTPMERGVYRISFDTGAYFKSQSVAAFYPEVVVIFEVTDPGQHYHVPLLISPYGYSTYRGS